MISNYFGTEKVALMCGGEFPEANGFDWKDVEYFRFEEGFLRPYRGNQILPGHMLRVTIQAQESL